MVPRFGLLVMIAAVTALGLLAAHTSLFELMAVTLLGFLAGGMRVRARLRPGQSAVTSRKVATTIAD